MIDFHSHIIPGIDDGSESAEMSVEMLRISTQHGVTDVVSTSHCYPRCRESIEHFLDRRRRGMARLSAAMAESDMSLPKIHLACEVNMYTDIAEFDNIGELRIGNTDYIMIEMPYDPWKEWMIDSVYKLTVKGLKPIMAHIDRFLMQDKAMLESLYELDVLYQVNAELFADKKMSKFADKLLSDGHAHVLGSDMHNTRRRSPNMGAAYENILKRYGEGCISFFTANSEKILNNKPAASLFFDIPEKQPFFSRLWKK